MELVVGASESTVKSVLGKLGGLLADEYSLIRGVHGDLQYISDEMASMQSFLRDLGGAPQPQAHGHRMRDWMKQIRDVTYDVEDCIDDSAQRIHRLPANTCCYSLANAVHELLTAAPRRDIAAKIANLKMRAQQIAERRHRYGVDNPATATAAAPGGGGGSGSGFNAADNQDRSFQLVSVGEPVGVEEDMEKLEGWLKGTSADKAKFAVMSIVGFGGVGKTTVATDLYRRFGDKFDHRAVVTVSQSSDLEAILTSILAQVKPMQSNTKENQAASTTKNCLAAAVQGLGGVTSAVVAKCGIGGGGDSGSEQHSTKLDQLKQNLQSHLKESSYLVLIDDLWSTSTWEKIRKSFPPTTDHKKHGRIIVTTRFQAVATTCKREQGDIVHSVGPLKGSKPQMLFEQAFFESKGTESVKALEEMWRLCGGLPLAIVTMAGYVACNSHRSPRDLSDLCSSLFPDSAKDGDRDLTQEEVGRIVSHCYDDMPAEIKTCSLYLSIFPKGKKISRKHLTRRWIAEGFVSEKQGMSVEDVAETYFNHLIRRKIIRPVEHNSSGKVKCCIVHDMILEHIVAKASEENFITVVGGHWIMQPPSSKVRRLSLQVSDSKYAKDTEKMNLSHVRSLTMFGSLNQLPSQSFKFGIVQVLDLQGCTGFRHHHTNQICEMLLLKYLSLRSTDIGKLPKTIRKLVNLETLDIRETDVVELPKTICSLERLVNILGGNKRTREALKLPEELVKKKKMKALRILSGIEITGGSADFHHLTELRKLAIYKVTTMGDDASFQDLSSSIGYIGGYSLHTLVIDDESCKFLNSLDDLSPAPKFLVALELSGKIVKVPSWITQLDDLRKLTLSVTALRKDNLEHLSKLKELFSLTFTRFAAKEDAEALNILAKNKLCSDGEIIVPAGGFKKLKLLRFSAPVLPLLTFSENAMPQLERLDLKFNVLEGLFGAENLAGLKEVHMRLNDKDGETMTKIIVEEMNNAMGRDGAKRIRITLEQ